MRFDLPKRASRTIYSRIAATMCGTFCKLPGVDAVAVSVFTDTPFSDTKGAPHDDFVRVLHRRLEQSGFELRASLCQARDGWASYLDPFPLGGHKLSDVVMDDIPDDRRPLAGDQHSLGAVPSAEPEQIVRFMAELHRLHALGHAIEDEGAEFPDDLLPLNDVPLFAEQVLEWDTSQLDEHGVLLVLAIQQPSIRDLVMLQWASRLEVGDALFDYGVGRQLGGSLTEDDIEELMFGRGPRPNRERVENGIAVLRQLLSVSAGEHRLPLLTMLAWLHWALGSGSAAGAFLAQAVSINERYGMAEVLLTVFAHYPLPEWAFE